MKLLLDECVTVYLKPEFAGHEVTTVDQAGLKGLQNGELLRVASERFDVLITVDQKLRFQQNLANFEIAILILKAARTSYPFLKPLMPKALEELRTIEPGSVIVLSSLDIE